MIVAGRGAAVHETINITVAGQPAKVVAGAVDRTLAAGTRYKVFHDDRGQFHLVRTYRPVWAVVVGVCLLPLLGLGLLFFLVRRTESCTVTVTNGPTGALVTVAGRIAASELERLRSGLAESRAPSVVEAAPNPAAAPELVVPTPIPIPEPVAPAATPTPEPATTAVADDTAATVARPHSTPRLRVHFDDGRTVSVDGVIFVGRDPAVPGSDTASSAALVHVPAPCMRVSKTHLAVRFIDGCLWVEDLHSTNGTSVRMATGEQVLASPGRPVPLAAGSVVHFGERSFEVVGE